MDFHRCHFSDLVVQVRIFTKARNVSFKFSPIDDNDRNIGIGCLHLHPGLEKAFLYDSIDDADTTESELHCLEVLVESMTSDGRMVHMIPLLSSYAKTRRMRTHNADVLELPHKYHLIYLKYQKLKLSLSEPADPKSP